MSIKSNLLENKKFGVFVSLVIVVIYYIIKCLKYDNINKSTIDFAKTWLEMSLLFTFVAVTLIFFNLFRVVVKGMNENLSKNLKSEEKTSISNGIMIGFFACIALLITIIFSFLNFLNIYSLQGLSIFFAIVAYYMDKRFQCKTEMLKFDTVIILSLVITLLLSGIFQYFDYFSFSNKIDFVYGFTTGATAFQVFIAGLFFNTEEYSKNRIFKLKTNND